MANLDAALAVMLKGRDAMYRAGDREGVRAVRVIEEALRAYHGQAEEPPLPCPVCNSDSGLRQHPAAAGMLYCVHCRITAKVVDWEILL